MIPAGMMDERVSPRMRDSLRDDIAPPRAPRWWAIARKRSYGGDPEFCAAVEAVIAEIRATAPT